ncbi:translocation/assembly module TamB domain-containing protein [Methylobacterium sp. B4]|uniref:translocation/assembly module TamB domain-containing protein n=1 Tax=Methylobacterium sp. B4 TaxID=1938755 RepID=UPI000D76D0D7|nr:translocation/assembly module TamB domain-containing protein [Methylobacterium sp. B4]PXW66974.1 autotransporter secretion inner membrane protein TamB [Methylobacterium sp. B4]
MGFLARIPARRAQFQARPSLSAKAWASAVLLGLIVLAALVPTAMTRAADGEKTVLGGILSKALSTPSSQVSIGAVDGALSSDATIRDVVISDSDGPWLKLDRARLAWRRLALLSGRLEVDSLEIGRLEVLRRPVPGPAPAEAEPDGSLLPELPVKVEIKGFTLAELVLGESVAGQPARLAAEGKAKLGNPSEGLDVSADFRRLDAAGRFIARLLFVPKGERLEVKASLVEPAGGLLSKAANLPGTPPINFDLDGRGTLDSWNARLDFDAGPEIGARGGARISRIGSDRRLSLDLTSRIEGLVPGPAAAIFSGETKLDGGMAFSDAGGFRIDRLDLTSRTARLGISGTLSADRLADFTIQARAVPTEGGVTKAADSELDTLVFDGSLKGPLAAPRVKGNLKAAGLRSRESALDRIEAALNVEPAGTDPKAQRFAISADAVMEGLRLADPALRRAVGSRAKLTLRAAAGSDGVVDVTTLTIDADTARAAYAGRIGQNTLTGTLEAALADIGAFSGVAGRTLAGRLDARASLSGDPARKALSADLDLRGGGLVLGEPAADRLVGRAPVLSGRVSQTYDGYGFERLRFEGAGLVATLQGQANAKTADVAARIDLKSLAALDERLAGAASADARLTGSLIKPTVTAALRAPNATADGRPIRDLRLDAAFDDLRGSLDGTVRLSGDVAGNALRAEVHVVRPARTDYALDRLAFALGSVALDGHARIDAETGLGEGALTLRASDLDDLSALALTTMAGRLDATVTLSRENGRQDAAIRATGASLRFGEFGLAKLDADLTGRDLRAHPVLDGRASIDRVVAAGQTIDTVRLTANGTATASDIALTAQARGFSLDGAARLIPAQRTRVEIARFSAQRGGDRLALAGPATITLDDGSALIESLVVAAGSGRISVQGRAGSKLDLKVGIRALPLALARIASPSLSLAGTLDGEADIRGPASRPEGRYAVKVARLVTPETRKAGLPPIDAQASGTLEDGSASIDGRVSAGRGAQVAITGSVPVEAGGGLNLRARGTLDAALANSMLSTGGQRVAGRVALDAGVTGTIAAPKVEGTATLSGGSVTDPLNGIRLTDIQGRVTGRGDTIVIERLTAATRNGGRLSVDGRVAVEPASGFPGSLRITADRAELVSNPLMMAVSSLNLSLSGPLARTPVIKGRVDVVSIDVSVPDRLPATVQPLPGIRRVNVTPEVRERLAKRAERRALIEAAGRRKKAPAPFDANLDLIVSAPSRIFVRGRGIDAELGGELHITGSSRDLRANGDFSMRRGVFSLVGQRLDFTRGRVFFAGDLAQPDLDFAAETKAADVTARVAVTGPAAQPVFALSSDPSLPQDEILSRILFKKAAAGLSPFQALQLAQAVAQLSGGAGGPDVFEAARKGLGLDSLDVSTGASGGPAVGASRYINDRISVGVKAGAKPADTAATINYDVTRRIKLNGEAGSDGRTAVGVGAEWEW